MQFALYPHPKSCATLDPVSTHLGLCHPPSTFCSPSGWALLQPPHAFHPGSFFNLHLIGSPALLGCLISLSVSYAIVSSAFSSRGICLLCGLRKIDIFCVVLNLLRSYEIVPGPAEQLDNVDQQDVCSLLIFFYFFKVACSSGKATAFEIRSPRPWSSALPIICCVILGQISYRLRNSILLSMN